MKFMLRTATAFLITAALAVAILGSAAALAQEATPPPAARAMWGPGATPGWSMMSGRERKEHRDKMRSMKSHDECKAYQQQHHDQMASRAKERGAKPPAQPRRDACMGLKN